MNASVATPWLSHRSGPFCNGFDVSRLDEVSGLQRASSIDGAYFVIDDRGEPVLWFELL